MFVGYFVVLFVGWGDGGEVLVFWLCIVWYVC